MKADTYDVVHERVDADDGVNVSPLAWTEKDRLSNQIVLPEGWKVEDLAVSSQFQMTYQCMCGYRHHFSGAFPMAMFMCQCGRMVQVSWVKP